VTLSSLRRLALAEMVALLVGAAPLAQAPEPAQDDSIEAIRTRANAGDADAQNTLGWMYEFGLDVPKDFVEGVPTPWACLRVVSAGCAWTEVDPS